jgi:3-hydroxyisobutyrate dehydrogenase-like beta-hydroxyacid dehydrogenase
MTGNRASGRPAGPEPEAAVAARGTGIMGSAMAHNLVAAGQGNRMKLVVNAYLSTLIERVAETLEPGSRLGIGPASLDEVLEGGPLDAPLADAKLHKMARGDFAPGFRLEWAPKGVDLAIAAADGTRLPLLEALSGQWRAAVEAGYGRMTSAPPAWRWAITFRPATAAVRAPEAIQSRWRDERWNRP